VTTPSIDTLKGQGWIVTAQVTDQVIVTDAGQTDTGVQVYFVTTEGNQGSVFISYRHYGSPKHVKGRISTQAQLIDEIGRLTSDSQPRH
jgi:hypothetical protein